MKKRCKNCKHLKIFGPRAQTSDYGRCMKFGFNVSERTTDLFFEEGGLEACHEGMLGWEFRVPDYIKRWRERL